MPRPTDAYREGYQKGKNDQVGGALAELTMGMLRDDPGGHFAAGYRDGAAGKAFNPPADNVRKEAAELNPFDDKVAIKTVCPNCGALDWFEWKFLGRLTDPVCSHTWYVGSGTYVLMQLRAAFGAGRRFSKYMTSGISGEGAWIGRALGWFMGTILGIGMRLEFGLLMTPIQAIAGLCQSRKSKGEVISRSIVIGAFVVAVGSIAYVIAQGSQSGQSAPLSAPIIPTRVRTDAEPGSGVIEAFNTAPDYTNNWTVANQSGSPTVAYTASNLRILAPAVCPVPNSGTGIGFLSKATFVGNLDVSFRLNHSGFGRTSVYLWSGNLNRVIMGADLDTNDTNYLNFTSGASSTQYLYSSAPYLNTWITLRIQVVGTRVNFYADNGSGRQLRHTFPVPVASPPDTYAIFFWVGSVCWKSGPNDTSFHLIQATGTRAN